MNDVIIAGNSVAGLLAGTYLKLKQPDLDVLIVGPRDKKRPIVGESTIEATVSLLYELGMYKVLARHQLPKYGLTFYYKLKNGDASTPTYSAHESQRLLRTLSHQLNRFTFDEDLMARYIELGGRYLPGKVSAVHLGSSMQPHRVVVDGEDTPAPVEHSARWLIDASGRTRLLGRKLDLSVKPENGQRSVFWFRLADFDESRWLTNVGVEKPRHHSYDPFFCTHHFFAKGNWLWFIPLRPPPGEHRNLISIGITWRPDVFPRSIESLPAFLDYLDEAHPFLGEFVRTGTVLDTNTYRNYLYTPRQVYSRDRWFTIGDAAIAVDPLYSTGLAATSLQVRQLNELIRIDRAGTGFEQAVEDMDAFWRAFISYSQAGITEQYEIMDDSYQSHLTMHWDTNDYMHFYLPLLSSGQLWNPEGLRWFMQQKDYKDRLKNRALRSSLLAAASRALGEPSAPDMQQLYRTGWRATINYDFTYGDTDVPSAFAHGMAVRAWMRFQLLRTARWRGLRAHLPLLLRDVAGAVAFRAVPEPMLQSLGLLPRGTQRVSRLAPQR